MVCGWMGKGHVWPALCKKNMFERRNKNTKDMRKRDEWVSGTTYKNEKVMRWTKKRRSNVSDEPRRARKVREERKE